MKEILTTKGYAAIVDDDDYEWLSKYKWQYSHGYASRAVKKHEEIKTKRFMMHVQIMGEKHGYDIDHVNGNRLDNRRENLRFCKRSQNIANTGKRLGNFSSKYKGVYWHKTRNKWCAQIKLQQKGMHIGLYKIEEDAAKAYNEKAKELFGEFAQLNEVS